MSADYGWADSAYFAARVALRNRKRWSGMAEDLLAIVTAKIGAPRDGRSFGPVVLRLKNDGHIRSAGIGSAKTSNRSLKTRWEKAA